MIDVSPILLQFGRLAPLHPGTKRPWISSVLTGASNDPDQVAAWETNKPGCNWGLRIDSPELIVLDLESPAKGAGVLTLEVLEIDHGRRLSNGPLARTQSGGEHRYFRLPADYIGRIKNWVRVFPGIDVRVRGGLVAIPPGAGRMWIESFDDCDLPTLPSWFLDLMLEGRDTPATEQTTLAADSEKPTWTPAIWKAPAAGISSSKWYGLFHSEGFDDVWTRTAVMPKDNSQSAFEFSIAMRAFGRRFASEQVVTLLRAWWATHDLAGDEKRLLFKIIPAAAKAAQPFLELLDAQKAARQAAKKAAKVSSRIVAWISEHGPATPAKISVEIGITREAAKKQLQRLADKSILANSGKQYELTENTHKQRTVIYTQNVPSIRKISGVAITSTPPAAEQQPELQETA